MFLTQSRLAKKVKNTPQENLLSKYYKNTPIYCSSLVDPSALTVLLKKKQILSFSLSKMTFSHEMAQFFLLEQIYRGISINLNRRYHKD